MKKILALAAAGALASGATALAANPFSDVSTSDWAYQAVSDLSDQGIVEGYPDGTFKGETNITRYELAQVIARLMAKEDQYTAEQRATIDKLAGEYADELDSLGVRVSNREKKVGNISWRGNARMRWQDSLNAETGKAEGRYNGRVRFIARGQVNEDTYVEGRLASYLNFKDGGDADTQMETLLVHHQFGDNVGVTLGRMDLWAGQTGILYDDYLDGALVTLGGDNLSLNLSYGRMKAWDLETTGTEPEIFLAQLNGSASSLKYDLEYYKAAGDHDASIWGAGLTYGISDFDVFGDFYQNTDADGDPTAWTAGLGYGHYAMSKAGTYRLSLQYVDAEDGAYLGGATFQSGAMGVLDSIGAGSAKEVKFWLAQGDIVLTKNVRLHGEYSFDVDADGTSVDYDDSATLSLNYVF